MRACTTAVFALMVPVVVIVVGVNVIPVPAVRDDTPPPADNGIVRQLYPSASQYRFDRISSDAPKMTAVR